MGLSNDLISQFVKATNDNAKTKKETSAVYGTVKAGANGQKLVQLDGSEVSTPVTTTVEIKEGDRVMVTIKNHQAIVTGNLSDPSANKYTIENPNSPQNKKITELEIAVAHRVTTETFNATKADIDQLKADKVVIQKDLTASKADIAELKAGAVIVSEKLSANEADITDLKTNKLSVEAAKAEYATIKNLDSTNSVIHNLEATYAEFSKATADTLAAHDALIEDLDTKKLDAESAKITYANIDFSNIGEVAIKKILADTGLIKNIVVGNGTITGKLVGVTISGDLIEGNTIVAEKLVVKGNDGLYYKLNSDGVTTEAEQTDYNSLNGSVIKAKSITATKISVDDLVAFGATIGGFTITKSSLHSGVKSSVDNTTRGTYLDDDGQVAFGDSNNFIKYYKDQNGSYKLIISAENIIFASSKKSAESTINDLAETLSVSGRNLIIRRGERLNTYVLASGEVHDCEENYRSATVLDPIRVEGGQTYTFSKSESAVEYFRWAWYDKDMNVIGRTADNASTFTWVAPESAMYVIVSYPYTQGSNVKMEKGDTATAYCPALEDVGNSITTLDTRIDNVVGEVKAEIDSMEIGGRNLIKNSNFANGIDKWTPTGVAYDIDTDAKHGTYIKITSTSAGYSEQRIYPETNTNFNHYRGTFTLSFYAKTDEPCTLQTNIAGGTTGVKNYQLTTDWVRYTHTYDCTSTGSLTFWLNDANTTAYITKIKLEQGNKPTDWTPAPEDMATSEEVAKAQSSADAAHSLAEETKTLIAQLSDSISMLVTDGNGTSLMTQTDEGWTFSTSEIQTTINTISEGLANLTKEVGDTNSVIDILQQSVNDLGTISEYVKISTYEDEPCIELGEGDSDFKLRITNTRMMFTEGSTVLAYFNNQSFHVKKAVVEEELQQGGFVWKVRSNGNLGLVWKGGAS